MSVSVPLVLVADDEPSMLELVARHLRTMKSPAIEVIEASDGEQAWDLARAHLPDLVVLDVMMPGMSGWEVCRKIREDVSLAHTGVLMLTGIGENLNQLTSPLYGADAYIDKPFDFGELDDKVRTALEARAGQREGISRPRLNGVGGAAKPARLGRKAKPKKKSTAKAKPAKVSAKSKAAKAKSAKKAAPKKAAVKNAAVKKAAPKRAAAKKAAPKRAAAKKKTAPKKPVVHAKSTKNGKSAKNGATVRNGAVSAKGATKGARPKSPPPRKSAARGKARATR